MKVNAVDPTRPAVLREETLAGRGPGLGPELAREFLRLKRMEWTEYSRHVSEWETKRYLEFF